MQHLAKYMPAVTGYRERLSMLQGAWDSLALLSHLSQDGTSLSGTRQAFESLAGDLITHLAAETHRKALLAARARAQVAIDIFVRNLFERTADIGFLAQDSALGEFARSAADAGVNTADERAMQRRLAEYVAKYSVYDNVVLVSPAGRVLLQLEGGGAPAVTADSLVAETLRTAQPYVETFRHSDLAPGARRALIYSHRISRDQTTLGVLCLCFRFEDECEGIFGKLRAHDDWTVLTLIDGRGEVIATSDSWQVPVGARVPAAEGEGGGIIRFAGREYLAVTRAAQPYQGYAGPGWRGHVMVPLDRAFETGNQVVDFGVTSQVLAHLRESSDNFSAELRAIPQQADAVQRDLNRSVWNGSVRMAADDGGSGTFAKALLREISNMGRKTKDVFGHSIEELQETVVSSVLHDSQFMASLAAEILARNLYERANDCRWWALDGTLAGRLAGDPACSTDAATSVLRHINSLYTVYHSIVLLDAERRIVATSRQDQEGLIGTTVTEPWAAQALMLSDTQAFCVSKFEPSLVYDNRKALIYCAAVRSAQGRCLGAVAVVFDTAPQLAAMLQDCLSRDQAGNPLPGCVSLFLDRDGNLMAGSGEVELDSLDLSWVRDAGLQGAARVIRIGGSYYAVGAKRDTGYREYQGLGGQALLLLPLGKVPERDAAAQRELPQRAAARHGDDVREFATFTSGRNWYALPTANVIEAVDADGMQTLPGKEWWCAGYLMFQGEAISVVDLARVLQEPALETPRVVVVIRADDGRRRFGLLVELLGDVSEVSTERLLAVANAQEQLVPLAIEPPTPEASMVMVLNPEALSQQLFGAPRISQPAAA